MYIIILASGIISVAHMAAAGAATNNKDKKVIFKFVLHFRIA